MRIVWPLAERPRDRVEEGLIIHGLSEIGRRADPLSHLARLRSVVPRDENDRQMAP